MTKLWLRSVWLVTLVALTALAGASQAADLKPAPVYRAPPVIAATSWTGFYTGLGIGFRASQSELTTTSVFQGGFVSLSGLVTELPANGTAFRPSPYIGFNWQFAPQWVGGIEGDVGFA